MDPEMYFKMRDEGDEGGTDENPNDLGGDVTIDENHLPQDDDDKDQDRGAGAAGGTGMEGLEDLDDAKILSYLEKKAGLKLDSLDKLKGFDKFGELTRKHQLTTEDREAMILELKAQGLNPDMVLANGRKRLQGQPSGGEQVSGGGQVKMPETLSRMQEGDRKILSDAFMYNLNQTMPHLLPAIIEAIQPHLLEAVIDKFDTDKFLEANPDYEEQWKDSVEQKAKSLGIGKLTAKTRAELLEMLQGGVKKTVADLANEGSGKTFRGQPPPVGSNRREGGEPTVNWDEPDDEKFHAQARQEYERRKKQKAKT